MNRQREAAFTVIAADPSARMMDSIDCMTLNKV